VGFAGMRQGELRKKRIGGWGHLLDLEWWFVGLDWFYFGTLGGLWVRCGRRGGVSGVRLAMREQGRCRLGGRAYSCASGTRCERCGFIQFSVPRAVRWGSVDTSGVG
jgi:hypothetical protein